MSKTDGSPRRSTPIADMANAARQPPSILMVLIVLSVVAMRSVPAAAAAALDFKVGKQKERQKFRASHSPHAMSGTFANGNRAANLEAKVSDQNIPFRPSTRRSLGNRLTPLVRAIDIPACRNPKAAAVVIPISTRCGRKARADVPSVRPIRKEAARKILKLESCQASCRFRFVDKKKSRNGFFKGSALRTSEVLGFDGLFGIVRATPREAPPKIRWGIQTKPG